ncbi:MAG: hypothetical protein LBI13_09685, partial [Streptococcaceae bacterium]|nr:hypothetical protein [Streptococcaceae bacterium]
FHEGSSYSSQQSHWQQSVVQEAYHHMKSLAEQQNDTMKNSCRVARIEIEDKIEALHKERNALPW